MTENDLRIMLIAARGECPDADTLLAHIQGALAEPRATHVSDHVRLCGSCSNEIHQLQLSRYDSSVMPGIPTEAESRGQARFAAALAHESGMDEPSGVPGRPDHRNWLLIAAGILIVLLSYPAYLGVK